MTDAETREIITSLILEIGGPQKKPLVDSITIYHDLKISGDDAWELLKNVKKKFDTDFKSLKFTEYFPNEMDAIDYRITEFFGFKSKFKRLTLGHLLKVVEAGHWFEDDSSNTANDSNI